ncbi:MAG: DUF2284 domain-containing protein [Candidatus Zipacnadales bacterium]
MAKKQVAVSTGLAKYIEMALAKVATHAKVIRTDKVFTAEWVRLRCQYGCGMYGQCLSCPPYSPTPAQTRRVLDEYTTAILIHKANEEADLCAIAVDLERQAFLDGYYKAFSFHAGPCHFCEKCDPSQPCRNPRRARPAMEAAGIDVFATARAAEMPIEVVRDSSCAQNYYSLVLID